MLLGLVDGGGGCSWADGIVALGAFLSEDKIKLNRSQKHLLPPPSSASMSSYPYGCRC